MLQLNFPEFSFKIEKRKERLYIFDTVRKKWVVLSPEEWVRQNMIQYLSEIKGYSVSMMAVEKAINYPGRKFRTDIVVYNSAGEIFILVECKASYVAITRETLYQAGKYYSVLNPGYLVLTNGLIHYVLNEHNEILTGLEMLPASYQSMG